MKRKLVQRIQDNAHELISSARIEGAAVFNADGERLGVIHSVMLNKRTGKAAYVVMLLEEQAGPFPVAHPLPWPMLHYDTGHSGYVVDLSRDVLAAAPSFALDSHERLREVTPEAVRAFYRPFLPRSSTSTPSSLGWPS